MKPSRISIALLVVSLFFAPALPAQSPDSANQNAASPAASAADVPRLIKFSSTLLDAQDRPLAGPVGVTFALHAQQTGGAALWMETQNVAPDAHGNYTVLLGANSAKGVPAELFTSNEARWLGIQVGQQPERERILLVSVPYALKARDADTVGGMPASAFQLAQAGANVSGAAAATPANGTATTSKTPETVTKSSAGVTPAVGAATNYIPVFTSSTGTLGSSTMYQSGTNIGVGTTTPAVAVDVVENNAGLRLSGTGTHQVTVTGATSGRLGQDANGFFFSSDTNGSSVRFLTNNGTLNEWMRITSAGNVGIGTTTPGAKLEIAGGNLALPNTTSGGTAGVVTLGGAPFLHNFGTNNTFVGASAGNLSMTGANNSAFGTSALGSNTTGCCNAAFGGAAGLTAFPANANTTGFLNTFLGFQAGPGTSTQLTNATAIGANALVSASNAMVLGNGAINVGIGTQTPGAILDVETGTTGTGLRVRVVGTGGVLASFGGSGDFQIDSPGVFGGRFIVKDSSGNVGIGTNAPANTLEVKAGGTTLADAWTTRSSARFKTNVQPLLGALAKVQQLRGVSYDLKATGKHQIGLIAEEVARVLPEVVSFESNGTDAQGLDYARLTALLIEAVKQQQVQISEQQMLISRQEDQLQVQRAEIGQLAWQVKLMQASLHQSSAVRTTKTHMHARHAGTTHTIPPAQTTGK